MKNADTVDKVSAGQITYTAHLVGIFSFPEEQNTTLVERLLK